MNITGNHKYAAPNIQQPPTTVVLPFVTVGGAAGGAAALPFLPFRGYMLNKCRLVPRCSTPGCCQAVGVKIQVCDTIPLK